MNKHQLQAYKKSKNIPVGCRNMQIDQYSQFKQLLGCVVPIGALWKYQLVAEGLNNFSLMDGKLVYLL